MLEDELRELSDAQAECRSPRRSPWDQDEVEPAAAIEWAWEGVAWLIEQGIEDVERGAERIRQEATRMVDLEALTARAPGGRPSLN